MKRYRPARLQLDTRASMLAPIDERWDESVKASHRTAQEGIREGLLAEFGRDDGERKIQDFVDLGPLPLSVVAFHNVLLSQARDAFTLGAYYPALAAVCALGERLLNQLVLALRDLHQGQPGYGEVEAMTSMSNWNLLIRTLAGWGALAPGVGEAFKELSRLRHRSLHYNAKDPVHQRDPALEAHRLLTTIVDGQFGLLGKRAWSFWIPGEIYIKKKAEKEPLIERIYLPHCVRVGPWHKVESGTLHLIEYPEYESREISDEEFAAMRRAFNDGGQKWPDPHAQSAGPGDTR